MNNEGIKTRLPAWAKKKLVASTSGAIHEMKAILRKRNLHTVCESARCPNIGECFSKPTATFMILGDVCTRRCGFCSIEKSGAPLEVDLHEPGNIALTAKEMGLKHVVITSVTRDDLPYGGAGQFALTIKAIKDTISAIIVEVLTPDFNGDMVSLDVVLKAGPDIFNHNIETVPSLYKTVRPKADYQKSLSVLRAAKESGILTKSGIMVGLGETKAEVRATLADLKAAGCDAVTIGQYLRPTRLSLPVEDYVAPEVFVEYEAIGKELGIRNVYSGTFVRSSYNADKQISI